MSQTGSFAEHFSTPLSPPPTSREEHSDATSSDSEASKPSSFKQPPPEILLDILEFALPPTIFLDASLACGPLSAWCLAQRTKRALVLVCKFWREIGTPLLYQEIHLRRIGQVAALLSTLRSNTRLGEMIMAINVSCHVMPQYIVMFDEAFQRILAMSPNATRLSLSMGVRDLLVCPTRQHNLSRLVHLDLQVGNERLADVLLCLPQCKSLTILSLSFNTYDKDYCDVTYLTLEHLQEFQITVMWSSRRKLDFLDTITRKWKLPSLCRFTMYEWRPKLSHISQYLNFLGAHGERLTTLSITAPLDQYTIEPVLDLQPVQSVLDRCPALEHLTLFPPMTELAGSHEPLLGMRNIQIVLDQCSSPMHGDALSHKTMRWMDIWATWHPSAPDPNAIQVSWKSQCFPQLQAIRLLDWALLRTTGPRLHLVIPPGSVQHHETLQWRFPGVHVQHDGGHICKRDMDYVSSYVAACAGHESFRSADNTGIDSMSEDSDYNSDDETFESVSSVSYSAYDSEEGDLETVEYFPVCYDVPDRGLEDETNVDVETVLHIYRNILGA